MPPTAEAAGLTVQLDEAPFVTCVLNNLVSNAIKFSHPGSTIRVDAERLGDEVHMTLADQGIGMSPALVADIFRTDRPTSRAGTEGELGTGFGMPLVKQHIEHFSGRIAVESRSEEDHEQDHSTHVHLYLRAGAAS